MIWFSCNWYNQTLSNVCVYYVCVSKLEQILTQVCTLRVIFKYGNGSILHTWEVLVDKNKCGST